jgi:protein-L-isoaspartate(D-aspartate) O-methyltransferase
MAWQCSASSNIQLLHNLRHAGILKTDRVFRAMMAVDRGGYVPRNEDAYADSPQPIGYNATISAPHMHAEMLELLQGHLHPGAIALDVGSGSGYLTACMGQLVKPDGKVYGVEHIPELTDHAQRNMKKTNLDLLNDAVVEFIVADGRQGLTQHAPFDAIHVGAAAADVPQELIKQLKNGGRLVVPVGSSVFGHDLMVFDKDQNGRLHSQSVAAVRFVPLTSRESQLRSA